MNKPRIAALGSLLPLAVGLLGAQDRHPRDGGQMHRLHQDPDAYIAMLEDPARDAYQKPEAVIEALNLQAGETVADIGAGSGYFALRIARRVGESGRVYAVDISPDMIRHVNRRVRELGAATVVSILADPDDPLLPEASVDRFFICDTWHHIDNRAAYLAKLRRMLKPGGQIVMIDFQKRELPVGPPPAMKIAQDDLIQEMQVGGFEVERRFDFLPYQYFLIFKVSQGVARWDHSSAERGF